MRLRRDNLDPSRVPYPLFRRTNRTGFEGYSSADVVRRLVATRSIPKSGLSLPYSASLYLPIQNYRWRERQEADSGAGLAAYEERSVMS
jgi:hypothetical protein